MEKRGDFSVETRSDRDDVSVACSGELAGVSTTGDQRVQSMTDKNGLKAANTLRGMTTATGPTSKYAPLKKE